MHAPLTTDLGVKKYFILFLNIILFILLLSMLKTEIFTLFAETVFFSGFFDAYKVQKNSIYLKENFFVTM